MKDKLRVMSLFAGCGGMDLGFVKANHPELAYSIAWANDFNQDACDTYKKNFKHEIVCGDIWNINLDDTPDVDIIVGGFPCQDFSMLRGEKRQGLDAKRGLLYTKFVEAVAKKLPLFFVAENVKGLLTMHDGWAIEKIVEDFSKVDHIGYDVKYKLINFADYGVPQKRERVVIVGVRKDLGVNFEFPKPTHKNNHVGVKKALEGVEKVSYNNEKLGMNESTRERLSRIPPGGNYKDTNEYKDKKWMSLIWRRTHPDKPSPTIVAGGGGGTWGYHYSEPRPLTNRERARIQTFPDEFIFSGTTTEVRRQLGNAVPPMGIKPVAEQILNLLHREVPNLKQMISKQSELNRFIK